MADNTQQLKSDIDTGRTGDKIDQGYDPGLAPLGTDDEAAGTPPTPFRVGLARRYEGVERWMRGSRAAGAAHHKRDGVALGFLAFTGGLGVVLAAGVWLARSGAPGF